ncbi:MAG: short-chain dehydrogenase [Holophagae bacterium]|nr:MAG: short-chain dehydrogenase [Holophagae bacterium]
MKRIDGTVAFITGASSGIGAALAEEFARRGADVVLAARRARRLEEVAERVRGHGRRALAVSCDVTRDGDLEAAVAQGLSAFGRLDWVVANAGFGVAGAMHKLQIEDVRRQFETNVFGVLRTFYAAREALLASRGCLAIMGSVSGELAFPKGGPYSMSKFAVRALAQVLWYELGRKGVDVTLIEPGFVESEIRQVDNLGVHDPERPDTMPRWLRARADVAARKMVRAIVRRRRKVVVTGHGRLAVMLERLAPGLVAWLVRRYGGRFGR